MSVTSYPQTYGGGSTTKTVTTTKEYDGEGRLVKETTVEQSTTYPTTQPGLTWGGVLGGAINT